MKYLTIIIAIILSSCSSQKISKTLNVLDYQEDESPYSEAWTGGAPGSGSGTTLYFPTSIIEGGEFVAAYFEKSTSNAASYVSDDKKMMETRFQFPSSKKNMDLDAHNEYGNEAPNLEKPLFELKNEEAIIAYQKNGKTVYVKLENITQKETIAYPSAPPRGDDN